MKAPMEPTIASCRCCLLQRSSGVCPYSDNKQLSLQLHALGLLLWISRLPSHEASQQPERMRHQQQLLDLWMYVGEWFRAGALHCPCSSHAVC